MALAARCSMDETRETRADDHAPLNAQLAKLRATVVTAFAKFRSSKTAPTEPPILCDSTISSSGAKRLALPQTANFPAAKRRAMTVFEYSSRWPGKEADVEDEKKASKEVEEEIDEKGTSETENSTYDSTEESTGESAEESTEEGGEIDEETEEESSDDATEDESETQIATTRGGATLSSSSPAAALPLVVGGGGSAGWQGFKNVGSLPRFDSRFELMSWARQALADEGISVQFSADIGMQPCKLEPEEKEMDQQPKLLPPVISRASGSSVSVGRSSSKRGPVSSRSGEIGASGRTARNLQLIKPKQEMASLAPSSSSTKAHLSPLPPRGRTFGVSVRCKEEKDDREEKELEEAMMTVSGKPAISFDSTHSSAPSVSPRKIRRDVHARDESLVRGCFPAKLEDRTSDDERNDTSVLVAPSLAFTKSMTLAAIPKGSARSPRMLQVNRPQVKSEEQEKDGDTPLLSSSRTHVSGSCGVACNGENPCLKVTPKEEGKEENEEVKKQLARNGNEKREVKHEKDEEGEVGEARVMQTEIRECGEEEVEWGEADDQQVWDQEDENEGKDAEEKETKHPKEREEKDGTAEEDEIDDTTPACPESPSFGQTSSFAPLPTPKASQKSTAVGRSELSADAAAVAFANRDGNGSAAGQYPVCRDVYSSRPALRSSCMLKKPTAPRYLPPHAKRRRTGEVMCHQAKHCWRGKGVEQNGVGEQRFPRVSFGVILGQRQRHCERERVCCNDRGVRGDISRAKSTRPDILRRPARSSSCIFHGAMASAVATAAQAAARSCGKSMAVMASF
eukprot:TRINITY_DN27309_c0_g3_i1.p1 TRINITY_DN27309_c0_g3~~TRINITY_DN27309_c0_g3_i1.p1  ORF type:complete len:796 (-),score=159.37 TRINITY_DN27309_c0_g3_i1:747-3134(-)